MPIKKTKADPSLDKGNLPDSMGTNQDCFEDEDTPQVTFTTYRDLFNKLRQSLDFAGYQLIATPGGSFCGFSVYHKEQLEVEGLSQPKSFYYFKKVRANVESEALRFLDTVKSICEEAAGSTESKAERKMWAEVNQDFADRQLANRSAMSNISYGLVGGTERLGTITGRPGNHKVVPQLSWFSPELQAYDPEDLLTLLPEAERKVLVLLLGRIMVGAKNTQVAEGIIDHTARSYGILVGREAGLGKSTLMEFIRDALETLGYTTTQLNSNLSKFGWGEIATCDLAYIDDLTDEIQKALLQNANLKSIVSNDYLKVEEKGIPAVSVRSSSVILGCTNSTNYSHYIGMDSGSISRLNQLDTYNSHELAQVRPDVDDARIKPYWEAKAKELGVTTRTLAARLLQHAASQFLEATGYTVDASGLLRKDSAKDVLEQLGKSLRDSFRIDVSLHHADELPLVISRLTALAIAAEGNPRKRQQLMDNLQYADFSPDLVLILMELFVNTSSLPEAFQGCLPKHLSLDCKKYLRDKLTDIRRLSSSQSVEKAFGTLVGELKSNKSFGYPSKSSHYQQNWVQAKRQMELMIHNYLKVLEDTDIDTGSALDNAIAAIRAYLSNITK